jgi:hypothetical protein
MAMIPSDPLAIELGLLRNNAIAQAQDWNHEAIRIGNLVWDYCEAKGWPGLELTFNGIRVARDDGTEVEPWEA